MKLPGAQFATVDDSKVRDYLLSPNHPVGLSKAKFFNRLGFDRKSWQLLQDALRELAHGDAVPTSRTEFGQKYSIRGTIRGPTGKLGAVETIWIIAPTMKRHVL